jgi:phosphate transport system permease protein
VASIASSETLASPEISSARNRRAIRARLNLVDRRANRALKWLAIVGSALVFLTMFLIAFQVIDGATSAFNKYGLGFLGHEVWVPAQSLFGGWPFIYGTLVTGFLSLVISTVLGVAIGLFLSLMAPRQVSAVVGPLVEMLAAVPSVVLGLIGIYLICPFIKSDIEPWVHTILGWTQIFGTPGSVGNSLFAASLVLTIMVVPIIAALTRDLFLTVPRELREGAEALGSTRWEVIRGVVIPTTSSGVIGACVLGLGRAVGEAIAVAQVVGDQPLAPHNLFSGGYTLAAVIANQYPSAVSALHTSSLFYLATILFAFGLITNLFAQWISRNASKV